MKTIKIIVNSDWKALETAINQFLIDNHELYELESLYATDVIIDYTCWSTVYLTLRNK